MPSTQYTKLADLAGDQFGFVSVEDARHLGIHPRRLATLAARGQIEHVARGLYRIPLIPVTPLAPYMQAALWPQGARGVISHATALDLYGLSDINPDKIHLTVPRGHRPRRAIPSAYRLHHEDLTNEDVTLFEGIPIVTAAKAIRQSRLAGVRRDLLRQAIEDGARQGWIRAREAKELRSELSRPTPGAR